MSPRAIVGCLYATAVAGLVVGVFAFGDYLIAEHKRLSVGEATLIWFGDGVALFWFTVYFARHFLFGVPINGRSSVLSERLWWIALISVTVSMAVDLGYTLLLREAERATFATAKHTTGTLEVLRTTDLRINLRVYQVKCSFTDDNQNLRSFKVIMRHNHELAKLPPQVAQAVRGGNLPVRVRIAYQADRPGRNWLADLGWENDYSSLYQFSLAVLLFQALGSWAFLVRTARARRQTGVLPWWYDLHGVLLVEIEAVFLLVMGVIQLIFDLPDFWA